jgi:hypothetical protein
MQWIKTVVVHRGARDGYHVARALAGNGLLEALVTDLYWKADTALLPMRARRVLQRRSADAATSARVSRCWASGFYAEALSRTRLPFDWKRRAIR